MKRMKKLTFLVITGFLLLLAGCDSTPSRQLVFFNNSDTKLNIVMEKDSTYIVDKFIEPHTNAFAYVSIGTYNIITFDAEGNRIRTIEQYELIASDTTTGYLCVDLEGKTTYAMILAKYLYEGTNSLAKAIQESSGKEENAVINGYYKSNEPFFLSFAPNWPNEPLPEEIHAQGAAWTLVPINNPNVNQETIYPYIDNYLNSLGTE